MRALIHGILLSFALLVAPQSFSAQQPVPIAAFFDNPTLGDAKPSPDGKHLALLFNNDNGHDQLGVVMQADRSVKVNILVAIERPSSAKSGIQEMTILFKFFQ